YEKGAFTGATQRKIGLVEAAAGGTLFLDELGDIPLSLQVKLLRLLETGTFRRVGGVETLRADFRLVAATHRGVKEMVEAGTFRRDLYYRISAFPIHLPALRERREDLGVLVENLLQRLAPERTLHLAPGAFERLMAYGFPGNIRELRNILERAVLLSDGDSIGPEQLPEDLAPLPAAMPDKQPAIVPLDEAERNYVRWALEQKGGDKKALAEALGISERTLYRKLEPN
ncbi:sigma-54-dependent Fis family transcriptional regulator, partial [Parasulfuritortus cantonensis]